MSVSATVGISLRRERGWDLPEYPIATWEVGGQITGDGSGGTMAVQVNLKAAGVPVGNMWSLEELFVVTTNSGVSVGAQIRLSGIESPEPDNPSMQFIVPLVSPSGTTALMAELLTPRLFIGRGSSTAAAAAIVASIGNSNATTFDIIARGYMWDPRSILTAQGGPRRPPDGMFPS